MCFVFCHWEKKALIITLHIFVNILYFYLYKRGSRRYLKAFKSCHILCGEPGCLRHHQQVKGRVDKDGGVQGSCSVKDG